MKTVSAAELTARFRYNQRTSAGAHGNGRDAPKAAFRLSQLQSSEPTRYVCRKLQEWRVARNAARAKVTRGDAAARPTPLRIARRVVS
jgi:hypothetical protein